VWAIPMRRKAHSNTYTIEANHKRSWLARMVVVDGRSANRSS
jgi:hypothetical protein